MYPTGVPVWELALWELACKRKAGKAGRQDTRDAVCAAVRSPLRKGSGILPGATLPFAGGARSHKARSQKVLAPVISGCNINPADRYAKRA